MSSKLTELCRELRRVMDRLDEISEEEKALNKRKQDLQFREIPTLMNELQITNLKIDGVGTAYTSDRVFVSVKKEDRPDVISWLKANGHGALVEEMVHHKTLEAFVGEQLEANQAVCEKITVTPRTLAALRRS